MYTMIFRQITYILFQLFGSNYIPIGCALTPEQYLLAKRYEYVRGVTIREACGITERGIIVTYEEDRKEWVDAELYLFDDMIKKIRNLKPTCTSYADCYWGDYDMFTINRLPGGIPIQPMCPERWEQTLGNGFVSFDESRVHIA